MYLPKSKYLISDLKGDWSKPSIKFFRSNSAYGYIMWLTIIDYYFEKKNLSIEKLVNDLEIYASRRTVMDFINKCVEASFIIKIINFFLLYQNLNIFFKLIN